MLENSPIVVVAIVTHRRPVELGRLLEGLKKSSLPVRGCVISDHAPGGKTREIAARGGIEVIVREDGTNPGPGVGWAKAAELALAHFGPNVDAVWFLDDDVVIAPDALRILWEAMTSSGAGGAAPLLEDAAGRLWAFPEPEAPELRETIRKAVTCADAARLIGPEPQPSVWCTGASFLVSRQAIDAVGFHRGDFWMLGEDLEYSMRVASRCGVVFTTRVVVPHLPEPGSDPEAARRGDYRKFLALLQNVSYLGFHCPHSAHMKWYVAGNFRRFFRTHGLRGLGDALRCFWEGAVRGRAAAPRRGGHF